MDLERIFAELLTELEGLTFGPPVTHVYNPLRYAAAPHREYLRRYGAAPKEVVLVGMNPGPWGMLQTGVPFGEVAAVRDWLGIEAPVGAPAAVHPKRPVLGFGCPRREVSGRRLWGWAQKTWAEPQRFFARFFVANYCPLAFFDAQGRNITPNQLRAADRTPLLAACDRALARLVKALCPRFVVGVGRFAGERARRALAGAGVEVGCITHPSPANPRANRGWEALVTAELAQMGVGA